MTTEDRLAGLLDEWQRLCAQGRDVSAAELCGEYPEFVPELARRMESVRRVDRLLVPGTDDNERWEGLDPDRASRAGQSGIESAAVSDDTASFPVEGEDPPAGPDALSQLGGYRLIRLLGQGGMGAVYLAEDPALGRQVAVKVMRPKAASRRDAVARFVREARAAAALQHDHVVPIYHVGDEGGVPYIVMPLLAGETLHDWLRREGPLPAADVVRVGREAAEGLAAAHAAGLVHRDIKPANLWLEAPAGRVKILDFGLARTTTSDGALGLTHAGSILGTPGYMSPEQVDGVSVDAGSDLFSLGCVLYHCATGRAPFDGPTLTAVLRAVADSQPVPPRDLRPEVPGVLSDLILRLLAKVPSGRPASARAVADALAAITAGAKPALPGPPRRRWRAAVSVGALVLALGVVAFFASRHTPRPSTDPSTAAIAAPLRAKVDMHVWPARLRLSDPGALPLKSGDQFRIEMTANRPAYLYLFWIDTEGKTLPVYPWEPGKWGTRPPEEQRTTTVELPPTADKAYTIDGDQPGMETLILIARADRLALSDEEIQRWFAGLPAQRPYQNPESAVWFENGRIVTADDNRRTRGFEETAINDPVLRVQGLLKERIGPHADYTAAVSFARLGRGGMQ